MPRLGRAVLVEVAGRSVDRLMADRQRDVLRRAGESGGVADGDLIAVGVSGKDAAAPDDEDGAENE